MTTPFPYATIPGGERKSNWITHNRDYAYIDALPMVYKTKKDNNRYMGAIFEDINIKYLRNLIRKDFEKIGKWWHKDQEIDIIALNKQKKQIAFFECKWKELNYNKSLEILNELKKKAQNVKWLNTQREELFGLIAKKIENKKELRKEFYVYDLDDLK